MTFVYVKFRLRDGGGEINTKISNVFMIVRFTRAFKGLISPPSEPPGEIMSFGVSPVNYSDSDSDRFNAILLLWD